MNHDDVMSKPGFFSARQSERLAKREISLLLYQAGAANCVGGLQPISLVLAMTVWGKRWMGCFTTLWLMIG